MTDPELPASEAAPREHPPQSDDQPPQDRPPYEAMLLLGAAGRNAGKTVLACTVISRFSRDFPVVGVKVTTVKGRGGPCPRGGDGCGACDTFEGPFCIEEETASAWRKGTAGKDTTRMLQSGALRVFWARTRAESLRECLAALRERIGTGVLVVAESNSLATVCDPGLFLMVRERGASSAKPTARIVARHADRVVLSDRVSFDLDPEELAVHDGGWQLLDSSAVILAGGASSRMGMDKSLLEIRGVPLIQRLVAQLRGRFREVFISADDPAPYRSTGLTVIPDGQSGQGPLAGIAAALEAAQTETVFVLACDIPDVNSRFVRSLLAEARRSDCAIPRRPDGKREPLFSAWRKSALPAIREVLAAGERKIAAVFPRIRMVEVDLVDGAWLRNLNTPQDVEEYLSLSG
jgi:molybdenum cofactor guanylyltransferase